jgi:hypothetical protein
MACFGLYRLILEIANIININRGLLRVAEIFIPKNGRQIYSIIPNSRTNVATYHMINMEPHGIGGNHD